MGDTVLVAASEAVYALSTQDGTPRWAWRLADADPPARTDLRVRWIRAAGDGFVVGAVGGGQGRFFGLSRDGKVRWGHTRLSDATVPIPTDGPELVVVSSDGPHHDLLWFDPVTGDGTAERPPPGVIPRARCAGGWLYSTGDIFPAGRGVAYRASGPAANVLAVGNIAVVAWVVRRQRTVSLAAYTLPGGGEAWRVEGSFALFEATERGVIQLSSVDGAWRPRRLDLATGAVRWEGDPLEECRPVDAGGAIVCTTAFELRMLHPDTGKTLRSLTFPSSLPDYSERGISEGRVLLTQGTTLICLEDAGAAP